MKLALISDLHANEVALVAVLDEIRRTGVDEIVCLGDVATLGPRPTEVVDRLRDLGCVCIMGNHDAFLLDPDLIHQYIEARPIVEAVDWCRQQLSVEQLRFIEGFRPSVERLLDGRVPCLLFHGTPRSHMEDLLATTPADQVDEMLAGYEATVIASGHTHIQMLRQHRGKLLVNPGSLGLPFVEYTGGKPPTVMAHAEYAVIEAAGGRVGVELRRVPLDKRALRQAVEPWTGLVRDYLVEQYS